MQVKNAAFLEIPLEIVLTPDLYIARAKGDLRTYTREQTPICQQRTICRSHMVEVNAFYAQV